MRAENNPQMMAKDKEVWQRPRNDAASYFAPCRSRNRASKGGTSIRSSSTHKLQAAAVYDGSAADHFASSLLINVIYLHPL